VPFYDVVVIGGGIIGLSTAFQLAQRKKRVLVLEQSDVGSGTSGACDHMILLQSKLPGLPLKMALLSLEMYKAWQRDLGENLWFETRGGMIFVDKEEHLPFMERVLASTYCPDDSQVDPFMVLKALLNAGERFGMELKKFSRVVALERNSDHWQVRVQNGESYETEVVICAAGVWSKEVCKMVGLELPIKPKRGQILVTEPIEPIGETNVWDSDYIIAKHVSHMQKDETARRLGLGFAMSKTHPGNYLVGSTREYVGFDKSTTLEAFIAIAKRLVELFPVFRNVRIIRTFAGLRPACEDGRYVIGEDPDNPGFFVATGHEGDGIALAPVTGALVTQLICGEKTSLPIEELSPARFRVLKKEEQSTLEGRRF
jgi:glycine/D-amino acid oxidase-like deaminating enzyme